MSETIHRYRVDPIVRGNPDSICGVRSVMIVRIAVLPPARRADCGGETMAIYLTQGGDAGTRVDEIERKLKSTIPDLKRLPSLEDKQRLTARNDSSLSWSRGCRKMATSKI